MALKPIFFLLASLLVVTTRVLSTDEELLLEAKVPVPSPAHSPVKVLPPPPPPPFPVTPPPAVPPVKSPVVHPPPVKPPVLHPPPVTPPPTKPPPIECTPLCVERCKLHSRKKVCWRACVTCCNRCKCVPPGTYGNREKCGKCYTNMTTRGGKPKCP